MRPNPRIKHASKWIYQRNPGYSCTLIELRLDHEHTPSVQLLYEVSELGLCITIHSLWTLKEVIEVIKQSFRILKCGIETNIQLLCVISTKKLWDKTYSKPLNCWLFILCHWNPHNPAYIVTGSVYEASDLGPSIPTYQNHTKFTIHSSIQRWVSIMEIQNTVEIFIK